MKRSKAEKILYDSYKDDMKSCLFILDAIRTCFDPVPECLNQTIDIVEWVYKEKFED